MTNFRPVMRINPMRRPYPVVGSPWYAIDLPHHVALIDAEDVPKLDGLSAKAIYDQDGAIYVELRGGGRKPHSARLHRVVMDVCNQSIEIDHINHDCLDNRRANLRKATRGENCANTRLPPSACGYRGVYRFYRRWVARIARKHIGTYATAEEAARAYDAAAVARWGEFATLNFPQRAAA